MMITPAGKEWPGPCSRFYIVSRSVPWVVILGRAWYIISLLSPSPVDPPVDPPLSLTSQAWNTSDCLLTCICTLISGIFVFIGMLLIREVGRTRVATCVHFGLIAIERLH
jgi:hypothetical protein